MSFPIEIEKRFIDLQQEIDEKCEALHKMHTDHTKCKKGCDQCCMNFNLLPIEFEYIQKNLKKKHRELAPTSNNDECKFLINHICSIYEFRPIICRTHGLPILNMDDEGENWELSFCPLNFSKVSDDFFHFENCYEQDYYNSKLFLLNNDFLQTDAGKKYEPNQMVELNMLLKEI